jgi:hypothetical protein
VLLSLDSKAHSQFLLLTSVLSLICLCIGFHWSGLVPRWLWFVVVPVFSAVGFSGARFVLNVSFHRIWKSCPASWSARRDFSFPHQSARAHVLVSPVRSPSVLIFLGPFFVPGLEFSSTTGRASVQFCSRHGFVFAQDSACACARKSSCKSLGSVPISFHGAGYVAGFQIPIHFPASVAPAGFRSLVVFRPVLPSASLSTQEEALSSDLSTSGQGTSFCSLSLPPVIVKAPFCVVQFHFLD